MQQKPKQKINFGQPKPITVNPIQQQQQFTAPNNMPANQNQQNLDQQGQFQGNPQLQQNIPSVQQNQYPNQIVAAPFRPQSNNNQGITSIPQQNKQLISQQDSNYPIVNQNVINNVQNQINTDQRNTNNNKGDYINIKQYKNSELEEYELSLSKKNKIEISSNFKSNIESQNTEITEKQPCIFDLTATIQKTKLFCQKHQQLASKIKEIMETFFMYDAASVNPNKLETCFEKFQRSNQIPNRNVNSQMIMNELQKCTQQEFNIELRLDIQKIRQEFQDMIRPYNMAQQQGNNQIQIVTNQLSDYTKFFYFFIVKKKTFHIQLELSDYYFFENISQNANLKDNFAKMIQNSLKNQIRLAFLLYEENKLQNEVINPDDMSHYFTQQIQDFPLRLQIIALGNPPDFNAKVADKYRELFQLYEKGGKSQIFSFIIEGRWPEAKFQKSFDESFSVLSQFQLWLIWMRQIQERINDFQLYVQAKIN